MFERFRRSEIAHLRAMLARQQELTAEAHIRERDSLARWRTSIDSHDRLMTDWAQTHRELVAVRAHNDELIGAVHRRDEKIAQLTRISEEQGVQLAGAAEWRAACLRTEQGLRAKLEGVETMAREDRAARTAAEAAANGAAAELAALQAQAAAATQALAAAQQTIAQISRDNDELSTDRHALALAIVNAARDNTTAAQLLAQTHDAILRAYPLDVDRTFWYDPTYPACVHRPDSSGLYNTPCHCQMPPAGDVDQPRPAGDVAISLVDVGAGQPVGLAQPVDVDQPQPADDVDERPTLDAKQRRIADAAIAAARRIRPRSAPAADDTTPAALADLGSGLT